MKPYASVEDMAGKTLTAIDGMESGSEEIRFTTEDRDFRMFHYQDCCESVRVTEVIGDVNDLIGEPLLVSEMVSSDEHPAPENAESYTWTFYRFQTIKGSVTLRWLGESNGYYSEGVEFE